MTRNRDRRNPVNPTTRAPTGIGMFGSQARLWTAIVNNADQEQEAKKMAEQSLQPLDSYVGAEVAVRCAGYDQPITGTLTLGYVFSKDQAFLMIDKRIINWAHVYSIELTGS